MDRHSLAGSLLTLCALTNVHLAAQQFPTGTFSAEFNDGSTGTVEISGPDAGGNYTVKLTVDGISLLARCGSRTAISSALALSY